MIRKCQKRTMAALAIFCLAAIGQIRAQGNSQNIAEPTTKPPSTPVASFNKATGILGMDVLNQKGERLGAVKDVVFDLKSERVAYAVVQVYGATPKLLAVPLSTFVPSPDGKYFVLQADKAQLAAATGLDPANWPSATNPAWGAQQTSSTTAWADASVPRQKASPRYR